MKKFKEELRAEIGDLAKGALEIAKENILKLASVEMSRIKEEQQKSLDLKVEIEAAFET